MIAVILLGSQLFIGSQGFATVADRVPDLDTNPACNGVEEMGAGTGRDKQSCMREENAAREQLGREWSAYSAEDRVHCTRSTAMGGVPSYVELQTCLEMTKAARELPKDELGPPTTDGLMTR